ncbi:hypothetical protein [Carboxydothermus pertinax]|uniref:Uncharacterized protein n=1 Tax=Carboxydothermus pertinax TaxID=870242 RepID=A0A1L8CYC6_9THEO|nr:hypothetical protein [Carboxydothermus pertinax]GAV23925.1 hypothetical protein cpu_24350 [Carboxydothermus pertinax]
MLEDEFPGKFSFKYVNIFTPEIANYPEVLSALKERKLSLPVVLHNGKIILAGKDVNLTTVYSYFNANET